MPRVNIDHVPMVEIPDDFGSRPPSEVFKDISGNENHAVMRPSVPLEIRGECRGCGHVGTLYQSITGDNLCKRCMDAYRASFIF